MSIQGYQAGGAGTFTVFPSPIQSTRDPTTSDIISPSGTPYQPGQEWINTSTNGIFTYGGDGVWSTSVVQQATETEAGIAEIATAAEAIAGVDDTKIMTPAKVALVAIAGAPDATTTTKGITELSTDGEAVSRSLTTPLAVQPSNLTAVMSSPGPIGDVVPSTIAATTLSASGAFSLTGDQVTVAEGGTGAASLTDHGVMIGSGTAAVSVTAVGLNDQIFIGQTGADPIWSDNLDIPGTLDVTGAAVFDSTVTVLGAMTFDDSITVTGALTVNGLITGDASATIDTAGAALNLGTDNAAGAVNIGTGTTIRAIGIGNVGGVAHTVAIGSASAGAISVDTAAGISLDAATASNFTVTGAADLTLASTAGNVNIDGVVLVNDSVNANVSILSGTSTGALAIGNAAAGAMTFDSSAGLSLDGATASNFTVTGAGQDLTLASSGGSLVITASEASATAIAISASDAAGGVTVQAGTGGILIGTDADTTPISIGDIAPTASRTITVGGGTVVTASVTDTIDIAPDGATTNADSIKTVNINTGTVAVGELLTNVASGTVTSGTHTTSIASGNRAAGTMALNIMTGTGTKTANLGNADAGTTLNIDAITLINDSVNANVSILTGTSTGVLAIGNAAAGAVSVDSSAGISLDGATASNFTVTGAGQDLTLSSAGGSVLMSATEDAALAIRLHANGGVAETIQIHSDQGTSATSIDILSDVGGITLTATGLASDDAINLSALAGGVDIDAALQINIASSEAAADAIVLNASNAAGGIDLITGGGEISIAATGGNVSMVPSTASVAGTALAINARVGVATFTGLTTAAGANEDFTITNSALGAGDGVFVTVSNLGTNDADITLEGVITQTAGTLTIHTQNNGAAALNGDVVIAFWIIN